VFRVKKVLDVDLAGHLNLPSMTFDYEAVLGVVDLMEARRKKIIADAPLETDFSGIPAVDNAARVVLISPNSNIVTERVVPFDKVEHLSKAERKLLYVRGLAEIEFRSGYRMELFNPYDSGTTDAVADYLLRVGTLRVEVHNFRRFLPVVPFIALVVSWLWFVFAYASPPPLVIAGSILVFLAGVGTYFWVHSLRMLEWKPVGTKLREASRASTRDRLANAKATVLVSLVTVPIGLLLGFVWKSLIG
jgi:hypothetical protein